MEVNKELREKIFNIINDQLSEESPPEVKIAYQRLTKEGFVDIQSRQLIGQCVLVELYEMIKTNRPFDLERYKRNLKSLPRKPDL